MNTVQVFLLRILGDQGHLPILSHKIWHFTLHKSVFDASSDTLFEL
ncbi:hypothetical protein [Xenorhabdus bovienii]|uniref:Uncharacterized protein n=1 Tax=Xenorhabdus bovienii str. Intermedium TaxID=1379677 RepID=A0A077Q6D0_XENBV|nr:hypothetical protein [Xenorhabdus bovienii]MDE9452978.1 hypothetical protein [Xenorhabdus bovienii]CDH31627.1 hypothetical protein XBI1_1570101 [Xenorhabdus bovienii str. Intermedium]